MSVSPLRDAVLGRVRRRAATRESPLPLATAAAWLVGRLVPGSAVTLTEIAVVVLIGLSLDVALRRLATPVLLQPGALALGAWVAGSLLAAGQSAVVALAAAGLASAAAGGALGLLPSMGDPRRLGFAGIAAAVVLVALVPPVPAFAPPVLLGVGLGTPAAGLTVALVVLLLGGRLVRAVDEGELGRWLALTAVDPGYTARSGVDPRAVRAAGLAVVGTLAGLGGGALAVASMGQSSGRPVDPLLVLGWLLAPLLAPLLGGGVPGLLGGAAVFIGLAELASAIGLHPLALAGPALAAVLVRRAA